MRKSMGSHGLSGDGYFVERGIFYKRVRRQKWTPVMHEIEVECGVRIGRFRFGLTSSKVHWRYDNEIHYRRMWL
ncbi:hypothetical protein EVB39_111 [Rhizobium phage RHph_TM3_3_9]|nr:hypothetical protein EVB39_111 [Rhizobium phage RHph_TM3_3_9]QIG67910.1 hypothetical protein EVB53_108 [Rhizobium phage RHph_Y60]QIG68632.1 hypothetical protein EVB66_111 [Rhizobium phage RHph_TM3_3_13]QIG74490.1 hypothetical protein EVC09_110 [Rhizobium phage RHph_TM3_3_10]QXV74604.1 hypothetical protein [Rhizobium phage RHEph19]